MILVLIILKIKKYHTNIELHLQPEYINKKN